jgi:hypothetical protein
MKKNQVGSSTGRRLFSGGLVVLLVVGCAGHEQADAGNAFGIRSRDDFQDITPEHDRDAVGQGKDLLEVP